MTYEPPPEKIREAARIRRLRTSAAYDLLVDLAIANGAMRNRRDGEGYDEFIKTLQSGDCKLEVVWLR